MPPSPASHNNPPPVRTQNPATKYSAGSGKLTLQLDAKAEPLSQYTHAHTRTHTATKQSKAQAHLIHQALLPANVCDAGAEPKTPPPGRHAASLHERPRLLHQAAGHSPRQQSGGKAMICWAVEVKE